MSVVIRDIDKPRDCDYCLFRTGGYCNVLLSYINVEHGVDTRCPIIEINEYTMKNGHKVVVADTPQAERGEQIIDISKSDFGVLCVCALRYCHGRQSYMPQLVQQIVMEHFDDLTDRDLKVIADDEQYQSNLNLWGNACDKMDWQRFYKMLREWKKKGSKVEK